MNTIIRAENWADHHHPGWMDPLRIILGLFLIVKGIMLVGNSDLIVASILNIKMQFIAFFAAMYAIGFLLVGGLLIMSGLLTRIIALFELPILILEIFFVHLPMVFAPVNYDLSYSIITLSLLIFFLFFGSGPLSAERLLQRTQGRFE
ncbi:MAG: DoxX family protein [Ignavibacteriaceae bacterium]